MKSRNQNHTAVSLVVVLALFALVTSVSLLGGWLAAQETETKHAYEDKTFYLDSIVLCPHQDRFVRVPPQGAAEARHLEPKKSDVVKVAWSRGDEVHITALDNNTNSVKEVEVTASYTYYAQPTGIQPQQKKKEAGKDTWTHTYVIYVTVPPCAPPPGKQPTTAPGPPARSSFYEEKTLEMCTGDSTLETPDSLVGPDLTLHDTAPKVATASWYVAKKAGKQTSDPVRVLIKAVKDGVTFIALRDMTKLVRLGPRGGTFGILYTVKVKTCPIPTGPGAAKLEPKGSVGTAEIPPGYGPVSGEEVKRVVPPARAETRLGGGALGYVPKLESGATFTPIQPVPGKGGGSGESSFLPLIAGRGSTIFGTVRDTNEPGPQGVIISTVDDTGKRNFYKGVTDAAGHLSFVVPAGITAVELFKQFDQSGAPSQAARTVVGEVSHLEGTEPLPTNQIPSQGPAITEGHTAIERGGATHGTVTLHTRGTDPLTTHVLVDNNPAQTLAASDACVVAQLPGDTPLGLRQISVSSGGVKSNAFPADVVETSAEPIPPMHTGSKRKVVVHVEGVPEGYQAVMHFEVSGAARLQSGAPSADAPVKDGIATVVIEGTHPGGLAVRYQLSIPGLWLHTAASPFDKKTESVLDDLGPPLKVYHRPEGAPAKVEELPDGSTVRTWKDGTRQVLMANGVTKNTYPDGTKEGFRPDGRRWITFGAGPLAGWTFVSYPGDFQLVGVFRPGEKVRVLLPSGKEEVIDTDDP